MGRPWPTAAVRLVGDDDRRADDVPIARVRDPRRDLIFAGRSVDPPRRAGFERTADLERLLAAKDLNQDELLAWTGRRAHVERGIRRDAGRVRLTSATR